MCFRKETGRSLKARRTRTRIIWLGNCSCPFGWTTEVVHLAGQLQLSIWLGSCSCPFGWAAAVVHLAGQLQLSICSPRWIL